MSVKIKVNLKRLGKKRADVSVCEYEITGQPATVKELILGVTETGVREYNQRKQAPDVLTWMTKEEIEDKAQAGKIGFEVNYGEKDADLQAAQDNAIQCFEDGIYRIFLDGQLLERLDEPIEIGEESVFTFVRLAMLTGRLW